MKRYSEPRTWPAALLGRLPGLLGLGGLILAWLFEQEFFVNLLVELFLPFV